MDDQELDQHLRDIQRDYLNFLDDGVNGFRQRFNITKK